MKTSELLNAVIKDLEDPNSELMQLAETNERVFKVIASSCIQAAAILKLAVEETELLEDESPYPKHIKRCKKCGFSHDFEPEQVEHMSRFALDEDEMHEEELDDEFPDDYESCGECGFDHAYEQEESQKAHKELDKDKLHLSPEQIDDLAELSLAFDESEDPKLKKMASVLDALLLSVSSPKNYINEKLAAEDLRMKSLHDLYKGVGDKIHDMNKTSDAVKAIKDSKMTDEPFLQHGILSTRNCPIHHGTQMQRLGADDAGNGSVWRCSLDGATYDFSQAIKLENGTINSGGSIQGQSQMVNQYNDNTTSLFDSRQGRLATNRD